MSEGAAGGSQGVKGTSLRDAGCAFAVAAVSFLPFLRGALGGRAFFFRDLSLEFIPFRLFIAEGLRSAQLRFWNPYVHEGVPLTLSPLAYPLDWLQALSPSPATVSLTLALHGPLAALGAFVLARRLGLARAPSCVTAIVYSLGGFYLSSLNVYLYAQAAAWAPFVVWATLGVCRRAGVALVAVTTAMLISTTGVEFALLAILASHVLLPRGAGLSARAHALGGLALGCGLSMPVLAGLAALARDSPRAAGLAPSEVVANSLSPLHLLQAVWSSLLGDPNRFTDSFWAGPSVADSFPYFISIYLGPLVVVLAVLGATRRSPWRWAALGLLALGGIVSLGRHVGLEAVVGASAWLRLFRFPSKAFFLVHLAAALLAGTGTAVLGEITARGSRGLALALAVVAGVLVVPLTLVSVLSDAQRWFFPLLSPLDQNHDVVFALTRGLAEGALPLVALLLAFVGLGSTRHGGVFGSILVPALVAADLLRAGAGLNPMVNARFYEPAAGLVRRLPELRQGRVLSCDPTGTPEYRRAFFTRLTRHEAWTFALLRDTLSPFANMPLRVRGALGIDPTGLVPAERALSPLLAACRDFASIAPRVRTAAVTHVLTTVPLRHGMLGVPELVENPDALPLQIFVQRVVDPLPLWEAQSPNAEGDVSGADLLASAPGSWRFGVRADTAVRLVVREAWSRGWGATVDGRPRLVERTSDGHLQVALSHGDHEVCLAYEPPWLRWSLWLSAGSLVGVALLVARGRSAYR